MAKNEGLSRRSAVAGSVVGLWSHRIRVLLVPLTALSSIGNSVKAQPQDDPVVIVELRTSNLELLERMVKRKGVEIIRVVPAAKDGGIARAVIAVKRSEAAMMARTDGVRVELIAEPPKTDAEVPQVGKGNRFSDPQALPRGRGVLVK